MQSQRHRAQPRCGTFCDSSFLPSLKANTLLKLCCAAPLHNLCYGLMFGLVFGFWDRRTDQRPTLKKKSEMQFATAPLQEQRQLNHLTRKGCSAALAHGPKSDDVGDRPTHLDLEMGRNKYVNFRETASPALDRHRIGILHIHVYIYRGNYIYIYTCRQ